MVRMICGCMFRNFVSEYLLVCFVYVYMKLFLMIDTPLYQSKVFFQVAIHSTIHCEEKFCMPSLTDLIALMFGLS